MDKKKIEKDVEEILENASCELVDFRVLRHKDKPLLQFFIDRKEGGITLDECGEWSDRIGAYLDMDGIIEGGYILEVSSPGVDRILKKEKDFLRFAGKSVRIRLKAPMDGTRTYAGILEGFEDGRVLLENGVRLPFDNIDEARLDPKDLI